MMQVADAPYSSFDDSEQFEDSSSWISDSDQDIKWSGWKRASPVSTDSQTDEKEVLSLIEICSKCVAKNYPFETIEIYNPPIPDSLQLRIAYHSFPESEEEIRLYSCLASGSNDKFKQGEILAKTANVHEVLQIGFHLSGVVTQPAPHTTSKQTFNIAITFDRGHITSCQCSCQETATWCEHANALCIYRITRKDEVALRSPVSESLGRLERDQLQKFAQYLISELPQQILPTAQRLLDELLSSKTSQINMVAGAPDPTGGASMLEDAKWVLDEASLQENIKKVLARFCGTLPYVMMDSNAAFLNSVPPVSQEWSNLLRSFQGHDPEALWNLLNISRHLYAKGDCNASHLLHLITEECLLSYQMMFYWMLSYNSSSNHHSSTGRGRPDPPHMSLPSTHVLSRHASAHLMEEIVHLWELTVMSPHLDNDTKLQMKLKFEIWNQQVIESGRKGQGQGIAFNSRMIKDFPGFNSPLKAAEIDWDVFYGVLGIPCCNKKNGDDRSLGKNLPPYEVLYHQLVSFKSDDLDEYTLVIKLSQALQCHGFNEQASRLAYVLGQKIILTYPERIQAGELNFTEITVKAKAICETFTQCLENERLTFELAILGLTVPRFPVQTNLEEMKLIYLETELYKCLKGMLITEERLNFIRYQARKLLTKPMLRGDIVLPYIIAMLVFEVLCEENIDSCIYAGPNVKFDKALQRSAEDELLGYRCALQALGLYSNAVDHKQPMLCESIRQFRRELALVLLRHYRTHNEKIEEVLSVLLEKDRYSFMNRHLQHAGEPSSTFSRHSQQSNLNNSTTNNNGSTRDKKNKGRKGSQQIHHNNNNNNNNNSHNNKQAISFGDIEAADGQAPQHQQQQQPHQNERPNEQHSDSDSGNGDATIKRLSGNSHSSKSSSRKSSQQHRRHSRQSQNKNRGASSSGNHNSPDRRNKADNPPRGSWSKQKNSTRNKMKSSLIVGANNKRSSLTDSDSGQEMNSPYEGDFPWLAQTEDWDAEATASAVSNNLNEDQPSSTAGGEVPEYMNDETLSLNWPNSDLAPMTSAQENPKTKTLSSLWNDSPELHSSDVVKKTPATEIINNQTPSTSWGDSSPMNDNIDEIVVDFDDNDNSSLFLDQGADALPPLERRVGSKSDTIALPLFPGQPLETELPGDQEEDDFNIAAEMFLDSPQSPSPSITAEEESPSDPIATSSSGSGGSSDSLDMLHHHPKYQLSVGKARQESPKDQASLEESPYDPIATSPSGSSGSSDILDMLHQHPKYQASVGTTPVDQASPVEDSFEIPDILTVSHDQFADERPALHDHEDMIEGVASVPAEPLVISEEAGHDHPQVHQSPCIPIPARNIDSTMVVGDATRSGEDMMNSQMAQSLSQPIRVQHKCIRVNDERIPVQGKGSSLVASTSEQNPVQADDVDDGIDPNDDDADSGNDSATGAISIVSTQATKPKTTANNKPNERAIELKELKTALSLIHHQQNTTTGSSNSSSGSPMEVRSSKTKPSSTGSSASDARKLAKQQRKQAKKEKTKAKNNRNKARMKNTMTMQSIEAEAFSLFELAKALLTQYRNNTMPYFSVDVDEVVTNTNVNRRLQLAAFEIGIFALNIHNYSSPNWFSRTYSSYVSWIETLAIEIGTSAIRMLNEKWEGVLTPSEAIQIAGRASRGGDQVLRRTAVELSLSCLPYCQSLNSVEVTQTMTMCREQDHELLERACSSLENASRQGGVQPELLFRVAREWHYLQEEKRKRESAETPSTPDQNTPRSPSRSGRHNNSARPPQGNNTNFVPMYLTPEQFVQEQVHQQAQEIFGRQLPRNAPQDQGVWAYHPSYFNQLHHIPLPQQMVHSRRISNIDTYALPVNNFPDEMNFAEIPRYLQNSYRVGMLALKALTLRMPDDRPGTRFAVAPPCSDDIRWLCALAASLGPTYLKNFCKVVYDAVTSPFLLHDLALEAARHFALYNPAHLTSHLRSPSVSPIVQKALVMFNEKVHYDLVVLQPNKYNDFVELLKRTRSAFCMAPGGMQRFNDILEMIRKTYPKKGELWQKIMTGLSTAA